MGQKKGGRGVHFLGLHFWGDQQFLGTTFLEVKTKTLGLKNFGGKHFQSSRIFQKNGKVLVTVNKYTNV